MLIFFTADIALADYQIVYSDALVNSIRKQGGQCPKRHGSWRTKKEAEAARRQEGLATRNYHNFMTYESWVEGFDDPTSKIPQPWSTTAPAGGLSTSEQMAAGLFGSLFSGIMQGIMSEPSPSPNRSYQPPKPRGLTPEEKAARAKKVKAYNLKVQEKKEAAERAEKEKQSRELLAKMDTLGSGKLEIFKWERSEAEGLKLQTVGTGRYDTSSMSSCQRLLCAAYFSNEALKAIKNGDDQRARYLNEQAAKVSSGQMTDLKCKFAALPQPPEPGKPVPVMANYGNLTEKAQKDIIKTLQDTEIKIKETEIKKKETESKKEKAEKKIAEARALNTATPEDKMKAKSFEDEAQRLLQEAQNELKLADKTLEELFDKRDDIYDRLDMQESIDQKAEIE